MLVAFDAFRDRRKCENLTMKTLLLSFLQLLAVIIMSHCISSPRLLSRLVKSHCVWCCFRLAPLSPRADAAAAGVQTALQPQGGPEGGEQEQEPLQEHPAL